MTVAGTIKDGIVVLDTPLGLADGTRVEVTVAAADCTGGPDVEVHGDQPPTLQGLMNLAGTVKGMPPDFAAQHDHYIHGTPKR